MSLTKKIQRTEKLTYNDGSVVLVTRVPRAQLSYLQELQEQLLEYYVNGNLSFAALMMNDEAYAIMDTIFSMLPTVDGKPVDFSKLEDDYEQLARFFCSGGVKSDGSQDQLEVSVLSSLHHFNYGGKMGELLASYGKKKLAEQEALESQAETQTRIS
ncbi:MAG: hypothetical protein IM613_12730 [Cytophagales bacterium]|nr:hypothetical protein [Cytophagales bacterium]